LIDLSKVLAVLRFDFKRGFKMKQLRLLSILMACISLSAVVSAVALNATGSPVAPTGTVSDISSATWTPNANLTNAFTTGSGSMSLGSIVIQNNKRLGYRIGIASLRSGKLRLSGVEQARQGETGHEISYTISSAVPATEAGTSSGQNPDPLVFSGASLTSALTKSVNAPLRATESAKYDVSIAYAASNMLFSGGFSDTITVTYADL